MADVTGPQAPSGSRERVDVTTERPVNATEYQHRARYAWASAKIGQGRSDPILDVACGTGHGSELLAECGTVTGIDRDPDAVEAARARTSGEFIQASVPPLPLADSSFAWVVSFETIEHLDDDKGFAQEIARVLRPGGQLLISSPNREAADDGEGSGNEFHVREYSLDEFRAVLEGAGFEVTFLGAQLRSDIALLHRRARGLSYRARGVAARSKALHRAVFGRILDLDVRKLKPSEQPAFFVLGCRKGG